MLNTNPKDPPEENQIQVDRVKGSHKKLKTGIPEAIEWSENNLKMKRG